MDNLLNEREKKFLRALKRRKNMVTIGMLFLVIILLINFTVGFLYIIKICQIMGISIEQVWFLLSKKFLYMEKYYGYEFILLNKLTTVLLSSFFYITLIVFIISVNWLQKILIKCWDMTQAKDDH